jgi:hypothetical protein
MATLGGRAVAEIGLMRVVPVAALVLSPGLPGALQPSPAGSILRWIYQQFAAPRYCPCGSLVKLATVSAISTLGIGAQTDRGAVPEGGDRGRAAAGRPDARRQQEKQRRRDVA